MLRSINEFRVGVELRKQIGLATSASSVHESWPGSCASGPPRDRSEYQCNDENRCHKCASNFFFSQKLIKPAGGQKNDKKGGRKDKFGDAAKTIESRHPQVEKV